MPKYMISILLISMTQKLFFASTVFISLIGSLTVDITTIASRTTKSKQRNNIQLTFF